MSMQISINGNPYLAEAGQTILEVARLNDIHIPTLCHQEGLPSHGSCRLCIVEVNGRPLTPTACTTLVQPGMQIETDSPRLLEQRREVLRMLLADHPSGCLFCAENTHCDDCMVTLRKTGLTTGCHSCPADHQCRLQDLVKELGLTSVDFPARFRSIKPEKYDPFFDRDYNLCVLCGRCIRVCEKLHFNNIPVYVKRGTAMWVGTEFGKSHLETGCTFCGSCVDACPTGTLWDKVRKWDGVPEMQTESTCPYCSIGCEVSLLAKDSFSHLILGAQPTNYENHLCVKGRFGIPEMVNHPERLASLLQYQKGHLLHRTWDDGLTALCEQIETQAASSSSAMVISADCGLESLYIAKLFAEKVLKAPIYLAESSRYGKHFPAAGRLILASKSIDFIDESDYIVCLGLDLQYSQSMVEAYLKRAVEHGVQVVTINAHEHVPGRFATRWLQPEPGREEEMIESLANGTNDMNLASVKERLKTSKNACLVVSDDYLARFPEAIERLVEATRASVVALSAEANLRGAIALGIGSDAAEPQPKVLYLIGAKVPQKLAADGLVIYQHTHEPKLPPRDGWVLPMAAFSEIPGTLLDQGGRFKTFRPAAKPLGHALPSWQILVKIAKAMNVEGFDFSNTTSVMQAARQEMSQDFALQEPPQWLPVVDEHEYLGVDLQDWVPGFSVLPKTPQQAIEEGTNVSHP